MTQAPKKNTKHRPSENDDTDEPIISLRSYFSQRRNSSARANRPTWQLWAMLIMMAMTLIVVALFKSTIGDWVSHHILNAPTGGQ